MGVIVFAIPVEEQPVGKDHQLLPNVHDIDPSISTPAGVSRGVPESPRHFERGKDAPRQFGRNQHQGDEARPPGEPTGNPKVVK